MLWFRSRPEDVEFREDGTLRPIIRRSRADPFGEGHIAFTSTKTASLLGNWLAWRGPHISPLFCTTHQGKATQWRLSTTTVKSLIKTAARGEGLEKDIVDRFTGHSLPVGVDQDLLCAGSDTAAIIPAGRLKSVNILSRYLAKAEHNLWA